MKVKFKLNGKTAIAEFQPGLTLLEYLRDSGLKRKLRMPVWFCSILWQEKQLKHWRALAPTTVCIHCRKNLLPPALYNAATAHRVY